MPAPADTPSRPPCGPALVFSAADGSLRCLVVEVRDGLVRTVQLHGNPAKLGALDRPA